MSVKSFTINISKKVKPFKKTIFVDQDKSLSIRSFLIGSVCQNISVVKNALESEDVFSAINCLKKLGVKILKRKRGEYLVYGKGLGSFYAKKNTIINCGNSGTTARLLIALISTTPNIKVKIIGDKSLSKRSMKKLINLMKMFGATFLPKNKVTFPLTIKSSNMPIGIKYEAGISAQLKSAVILAGLNANGVTEVIEYKKSRDHTENMLLDNSNVIKIKKIDKGQNCIKIFGKKFLNPQKINVCGDPSSAAFFTALTLLTPKAKLTIKNVGLNPRRIGFYKLLKKNGAKISFKKIKKFNNEFVGDIEVKHSNLRAIKAGPEFYVSATDEYPILFVTAALVKGISIFRGISDLVNKESNRILEMKKILNQINVKSKISRNEFKIYGQGMIDVGTKKVFVANLGDHRICMSAFILALLTGVKTKIKNFETVFTSSPSFLQIMKKLGVKFEIQK